MAAAANTDTTPLTVLPLGDFLERKVPRRQPLLGSWFMQRGAVMVYAPPGVGKSFFSLGVSLAVAGGAEFLGWKAAKPGRVLFVDGEMDPADQQERMRLVMQSLPGLDDRVVLDNFHLCAYRLQDHDGPFLDLCEEGDRARVLHMAKACRADLVVLDNLSSLAKVVQENDAHSFDPILDLIKELCRAEAAVLVVHHARKNSGQHGSYRGSSKLAVLFDSIVQLSRLEDGGTGLGFRLVFDKHRHRHSEEVTAKAVRLTGADEGCPQWAVDAGTDGRLMGLVDLVRSERFSTAKEIAQELGVSPATLSGDKKRAISQGLIDEAEWTRCLEAAKDKAMAADALDDKEPF